MVRNIVVVDESTKWKRIFGEMIMRVFHLEFNFFWYSGFTSCYVYCSDIKHRTY